MDAFTKQSGSPNEKNIDELIKKVNEWNKKIQISSEEITFLEQFLSSDIFQDDLPNLYEHLFTFSNKLAVLKNQKIELHQDISNHKYDINGMLECEDISCESFYYSEHKKLEDRLVQFLDNFSKFQTELFRFCTNKLRLSN